MRFVIAFLICVFSVPAFAQGTLTIERATTLAAPASMPTGSIFMIINNSGEDDRLLSVKTDRAESTALHTSAFDDKGVMSMRHIDAIAIPAGKGAALTPLGDHIMLMRPKAEFKAGEKYEITLVFEKAGEVKTSVDIVKPEDLGRRFPPEMMGAQLEQMRKIKESQEPKQGWAARLREKIRSLGRDSDKDAGHDAHAHPVPGAMPQRSDVPPGSVMQGPMTQIPDDAVLGEDPMTGTQAPETQTPETQTPKTQAPETQTPKTQAPETQTPENQTPAAQTPPTQAPAADPHAGHGGH